MKSRARRALRFAGPSLGRMRGSVLVLAVLGICVAFIPSPASAQSTLYDDFSGTNLDPGKWSGREIGTGLELSRGIQGGSLLMSLRAAGDTTSDAGTHNFFNSLVFAQRLTSVRFDLSVLSVDTASCPGSSTRAFALARAFMPLFFDGRGNVSATIEARQDTAVADVLRVVAYLSHTVDGTFAFVDLGPLNVATTATLRASWNASTKTVDFQVNADPVQTLSYTGDDSMPPQSPAVLDSGALAANCTSTRLFADIAATFANVFVNP